MLRCHEQSAPFRRDNAQRDRKRFCSLCCISSNMGYYPIVFLTFSAALVVHHTNPIYSVEGAVQKSIPLAEDIVYILPPISHRCQYLLLLKSQPPRMLVRSLSKCQIALSLPCARSLQSRYRTKPLSLLSLDYLSLLVKTARTASSFLRSADWSF